MSERAFGFEILGRCGAARLGRISCAHGTVNTPAFIPVGTAGTVKAMTPEAVAETGTEMVLANTYHLMLRPGAEVIAKLGGLHKFMNWPGPMLTDSGGFQVMSLAELREISTRGVVFKSHLDGSRVELTPERAIEIQEGLDADIAMALDECTPYPSGEAETAKSMRLTTRWAERCKRAFRPRPGRALFGIVQGGVFPALRKESARTLREMEFDGYAVGGLAVGEGQERMFETLEVTAPLLPDDAPRYLMGVGLPADIIGAVARGIDLFDCVLPTRSGRTGKAFTRRGLLNLHNARHAEDPRPLDEACPCPACVGYSRAYLSHLARASEMLGGMLVSWHYLRFYQDLMAGLRAAIAGGAFEAFAESFAAEQAKGDIEAV